MSPRLLLVVGIILLLILVIMIFLDGQREGEESLRLLPHSSVR